MDLDLPDINGREASRRFREGGGTSPIIMLTAAGGDEDTIGGLDAGASDYVTKPFKVSLLLARIRAQLRAHEQSEDATFAIGPYSFQPANKLLVDEKGRRLRLTDKEANIPEIFYTARATSRCRARFCWPRCGGITRVSPPTRWRPTCIVCARRSNPIRPRRNCCSPRRAVTA